MVCKVKIDLSVSALNASWLFDILFETLPLRDSRGFQYKTVDAIPPDGIYVHWSCLSENETSMLFSPLRDAFIAWKLMFCCRDTVALYHIIQFSFKGELIWKIISTKHLLLESNQHSWMRQANVSERTDGWEKRETEKTVSDGENWSQEKYREETERQRGW